MRILSHFGLGLGVLLGLIAGGPRSGRAASVQDEVRAADAQRVLATIAGDTHRLANLLSDSLTYGRADGRVQTKAEFLEAVRNNKIKYQSYRYEHLHITPLGSDAAVMTGRVRLRAQSGRAPVELRLRFLAVWRRESGGWHLLAYQSAPSGS